MPSKLSEINKESNEYFLRTLKTDEDYYKDFYKFIENQNKKVETVNETVNDLECKCVIM